MSTSQLKDHWTHHIEAWQASGLSQNAYCREHGLKSHQLCYWKRKLTTAKVDAGVVSSVYSKAFVPLTVNTNASQSYQSLCLRLPNGCEFLGIEARHLPIVNQLLTVLL